MLKPFSRSTEMVYAGASVRVRSGNLCNQSGGEPRWALVTWYSHIKARERASGMAFSFWSVTREYHRLVRLRTYTSTRAGFVQYYG